MRYLFALLLWITPLTAGVFNPQSTVLKNGLQVVVVPNPIASVVSVAVIYKVGTADDPPNMVGLSHFLEHLMFKGTKNVPAGQFDEVLSRKGARYNARTSTDMTEYTADIAAAYLELILMLEADRMQNLVLDEKLVASERGVVQEERRMRIENSPFGLAGEAAQRMLYWVHPYGVPSIGYPHHIDAYTREALANHYKTWYAPNNAILFIAGDVTLETALPYIQKYFEGIPSQTIPERVRPPEPDHTGVSIDMTYQKPRVSLTHIDWHYVAPNHRGKNKEHYYPLIILDQILTGNATSRLYRILVEEKHLAVSVNSEYPTATLDPEPLHVSATLAPKTELQTLSKALKEELEKIVKDGVTDEELTRAKRDILAELVFAKDSIHAISGYFERLAYGVSLEEIEAYPEYIKAVTREQVHEAAKLVFGAQPILRLTVIPGDHVVEGAEAVPPKITMREIR